jgi:hypothetical protein
MAQSTAHIRRHLRASQTLSALIDEIERRERLLAALRQALPDDMASHCRQAALSAGTLTLFVDSPVWVDRFRFLCPELIGSILLAGFSSTVAEVKTCKVRVLPGSIPTSIPASVPSPAEAAGRPDDDDHKPVPGQSALSEALASLARTLGWSTD